MPSPPSPSRVSVPVPCLVLVAMALGPLWLGSARGAELAPDDPSIAGSLVLWLKDPVAEYDPAAGVWADASGRGNDASVIGDVGGPAFAAPTLGEIDGGLLAPDVLAGVHFAADVDDLLGTGPLNGDTGFDALTIITVCHLGRLGGNASLTRPVGIGSIAATQANPGDHFNLGCDPSIRKDNGNVGAGAYTEVVPVGLPFIRTARMDAGGVDEWFNVDGFLSPVLVGAGPSYTTSVDRFYLGDLRCGVTPVPGFGTATAPSDFDIVAVLVYGAALDDDQVAGINEWLVAHLGGTPPPTIASFTATPANVASGEGATLAWEVARADTLTVSPGVGNVDALTINGRGSIIVTPASTTVYTLTATGLGGQASATVAVGVDLPVLDPVLSEFVASNADGLEDEDGETSDWIEIHNPNPFALDLSGFHLSDDPADPARWRIPEGIIVPAGGHLVVFASGKDRADPAGALHASFQLDRDGGIVSLAAPDGATVVSSVPRAGSPEPSYPPQITDVAFGVDETGRVRFLAMPTPGAPNGPGFDGRVADTRFSVDRGFFDAPIDVAIATATDGAEIRFTTDGSRPTATHGTLFTAPIRIATTTVLRAAAFKDGLIPTNVDTQSYVYLADVLRQPGDPPGFPSDWGGVAADYAMDPRVVDDPAYRDEMIDALTSIRTLSIVVPQDEFFLSPRGIYANPAGEGRAWEREVSFEFLHPGAPGENLQADGGLRIHGNGSRSKTGQPKHSFRVEFRGEYGPKRLRYRLFTDLDVDEFDSFILRGQNAHGWTRSSQIANDVGTTEREQSQYLRDSFARDLMKAMGHPNAGRSTYVHLYINGLYWGLYNPVEYPRPWFGVSHFGGVEEDFDVINRRTTTTKLLDGTWDAWRAMQALADAGLGSRAAYEEMETHIDVDNLIDYMLMHQYLGSRDGPEVFNSNNMRAIRKSRGEPAARWVCLPWDMEASMFEIDVTRNVNVDDPDTLARVYTRLRANPEFRLRYADRVRRHCFHGGALTPGRTAAIWEARAAEIFTAILGESARWGDFRRPGRPFTRDAEWAQERQRLLTTYFPTRTAFLVDLLRANDLYPEVDAPEFNVHGGPVPAGFALEVTAPAGTGQPIVTMDGTDPREAWTGNVAGTPWTGPIVLDRSATVKARVLEDGRWSALTEADFLVGTLASADNLAISELHYNPPGAAEDDEFIELVNLSLTEPIDLSGARFVEGITHAFPVGTSLAPGARLVLGHADFDGSLDNDGERIVLLAADGGTIADFRFNDGPAWPGKADGAGDSLVRVAPGSGTDASDPASWRSGVPSPGAAAPDGTTFAAWKAIHEIVRDDDDRDGDRLDAVLEFGFGGDPDRAEAPTPAPVIRIDGRGRLILTIHRRIGADEAVVSIEGSEGLANWSPVRTTLVSRTTVPGLARETLDFLLDDPAPAFVRVRVAP